MTLPANLPSYPRGKAMADGDVLADLCEELFSTEGSITAAAGGTQAAARLLNNAVNVVTTVASAADSVKLPTAKKGRRIYIDNSGANSMQVFGSGTDTINAVATATGVAQAAGVCAMYVCMDITAAGVGQWQRILSA